MTEPDVLGIAAAPISSLDAEAVKGCCASAYASEAARWLLGEHFHPGGAALTSRLARALEVAHDSTVVDVASGRGASSIQLVQEHGCAVIGVDLAPGNVAAASMAAEEAGVSDLVSFVHGDAERLPLGASSADGILCECSLCIFPDTSAAASEMARVLRPGGRLALSDVTAAPDELPEGLKNVAAVVACLGAAQTLETVSGVLQEAGLVVEETERHDEALVEMIGQVEGRLRLARLAKPQLPEALVGGVDRALELVRLAQSTLAEGVLGYGVVIARKPS